jgi:hypothetical protein
VLGTLARVGAVVAVVVWGALVLPLGLPILPPEQMEPYVRKIGFKRALRTNTGEYERLPQDYADMLGWEDQVGTIARVYDSLPPGERSQAVLLAGNYGEAGAIDLYGPRYGLPGAVSPVGTYWFFGPGPRRGDVLVTIGIPADSLSQLYEDVTQVAIAGHPFAVAEERNVPVLVARRPRRTLQEVWPELSGRH